jgi:DNA-binding NarL/FixJ family response regulator
MDQRIRVVVANQPRLMRELVLQTILEEPDIEIVAEVQNEDEIVRVVEETHPDFLIIAFDGFNRRPPLCAVLLRRYPEMKILALAPGQNISTVFWASFDIRERLVECSQVAILSSLRHKAQHPVGG